MSTPAPSGTAANSPFPAPSTHEGVTSYSGQRHFGISDDLHVAVCRLLLSIKFNREVTPQKNCRQRRQTSNVRLPLELRSDRRETSATRVSDDLQLSIFCVRRRRSRRHRRRRQLLSLLIHYFHRRRRQFFCGVTSLLNLMDSNKRHTASFFDILDRIPL